MGSRLLLAALLLLPARAAEETEPIVLDEVRVNGARIGTLAPAVPRGELRPAEPNLGQELRTIPGLSGHSRAVDAMEPTIRGLGFDRVATTLDGLPLVNASPERTNSPVVILGPAAVTDITVNKTLPSVTLGPVTSGGRITLTTADLVEPDARASHASVQTLYHGGRDGVMTRGRLRLRRGDWNAGASFFHHDLRGYTAPDGRHVAARLDESGASVSCGVQTRDHRAQVEFLQRRLRHQETLSVPLDGKNTETQVLTFNHRWLVNGARLRQLEWRAGYSFTDPFVTNEDRATSTLTFAQGTAETAGGGFNSLWQLGSESTLALGADWSRQQRRAVRTTPAGRDYIWPDAVYDDAGVFAEWNQAWSPFWTLRVGARADRVRSDARDADQPALGRPIREQFVTYNGPAASVTARENFVGAANVVLRRMRDSRAMVFVGFGMSDQPAPVTERYRAFLNALGGDGRGRNALELGNPALRVERKWALEAGGAWKRPWADVEATLYYYRIDDFILRTRVGLTSPPLPPMLVFGYRNVDAELYGGEVGVTLHPSKRWTLPLTFAIAEGENRDTDVGLAEIPPWEATAAIRYRSRMRQVPFVAELGGRAVGAKSNPAPQDNPLFGHAGSFTLWHLRAAMPVGRHLRCDIGIENLFNRSYSEYLNPPVSPFRPASGDLQPGERIPGPRRFLWLSLSWRT